MNTFATLILAGVKALSWHDSVRTDKGKGSFLAFYGNLTRVAAFISLSCIAMTQAHALAYLGSADQSGLSIVVDGSSNTLLFGEETRVSLCIRGGQILGDSPINDGSSNTIVFREGVAVRVDVLRVTELAPVAQIADGTSNTIILNEIGMHFCLADITIPIQPIIDANSNTIVLDEQSEFDACFDRVRIGAVTDGTSNTVVLGEITDRSCYTGVSAPPESLDPVANVSEPVSIALVGIGMAILGLYRRRRSD